MRGAYEEGLRLQKALTQSLSAMPEVLFAFREEGIGLGEVLSVSEAPFTMGVMAENASTALEVAEQLKPDDPENRSPFGPQNFMPVASPEEVVAVLREAAAQSTQTHAALETSERR